MWDINLELRETKSELRDLNIAILRTASVSFTIMNLYLAILS